MMPALIAKREKITTTKIKKNNIKIKYSNNKENSINFRKDNDNNKLINEIRNNEKLLEKIKYLQLWWKTIYHIIKIYGNSRVIHGNSC